MQPKFDQYHASHGAELICPSCDGNYLNHGRIEIFVRGEDQEHGLHVSVDGSQAAIDTNLAANPSARRHGLSIHFRCENCDANPVLHIAQHKGNTFVDFLKEPLSN